MNCALFAKMDQLKKGKSQGILSVQKSGNLEGQVGYPQERSCMVPLDIKPINPTASDIW